MAGGPRDRYSSGKDIAVLLVRATRTTDLKGGLWAWLSRGCSYLPLLSAGFTVPALVTQAAVRSYRTLSPLPVHRAKSPDVIGGLLSVALAVTSLCPEFLWRRPFIEPGLSSPPSKKERAQRSDSLVGKAWHHINRGKASGFTPPPQFSPTRRVFLFSLWMYRPLRPQKQACPPLDFQKN